MTQQLHFTNKGGYTLIELVVSVAIFAVLLGLVIANFHQGGLAHDLRLSAQELAGSIRRVQNLSTVGQTLSIGGTPTVPPGGYGIFVAWDSNTNEYTMYADVYNNFGGPCKPSNANNADSEYTPACNDPIIEAGLVQLRSGVMMNKIARGDQLFPQGAGAQLNIGFKPPKPIPLVNGETGHTIQIELKHTQTNDTRTITIIGASGQVSERLGDLQL